MRLLLQFATTAADGKTYNVDYFNLDVIISVGYRVKSQRGTQFRQWANKVLKDYLVKGYAVNERIHKEQIGELRQLVGMLGRTLQNQPLLSTDERLGSTTYLQQRRHIQWDVCDIIFFYIVVGMYHIGCR